jgi:predicted enzyme related to lactoylglutathione lyase
VGATGLQDVEQFKHSGGRPWHRGNYFRDTGRIMSGISRSFGEGQNSQTATIPKANNQRRSFMQFTSIRIITDQVTALVGFYERLSGNSATWFTDDFAEVRVGSSTLAIASTRTVGLFAPGSAQASDNRSVIIEFLVDDVDSTYEALKPSLNEVVTEPTTMPWGNRSLLFRDPDGNLVNLFTPVSPEAIAKFQRQVS